MNKHMIKCNNVAITSIMTILFNENSPWFEKEMEQINPSN